MAFSRQRELIKTQEIIWKQQQQKKKLSRKKTILLDNPPGFTNSDVEENEGLLETDLKHGTIFVSIASYRDPECPKTLADCFEKATFPGRIFVGVCQQNQPTDIDCIDGVNSRYLPNIRAMRLEAEEARGPVYARALIEQNLFRDENYYLIIDSHTLFAPGWDVSCIQQLIMCPSLKPVLTCYPPEYDIQTRQLPANQSATFLKFRDFHPRLGFSQQDPVRYRHPPSKPQPCLFWAAGFSFTLGEVVKNVPYDINLQYVFLGEEISMAARLFTHGYDIFAPMNNVVFHHTLRTYRPVFWELFYKKNGISNVDTHLRHQRKELEAAGNARIKDLLSGGNIEEPYGLGNIRTLAQFQEWVGLDFISKSSSRHSRLGLSINAEEEERWCKYGIQSFS